MTIASRKVGYLEVTRRERASDETTSILSAMNVIRIHIVTMHKGRAMLRPRFAKPLFQYPLSPDCVSVFRRDRKRDSGCTPERELAPRRRFLEWGQPHFV